MLVDVNGKPLRKTNAADAVIFVSEDGEDWMPMEPKLVPSWVKSHDVMGDMMQGGIVSCGEHPDEGPYYCAGTIH